MGSVRQLHRMGYKLYGSSGTSDFYREHGIPVETVDWLFESIGDDQVEIRKRFTVLWFFQPQLCFFKLLFYQNMQIKNQQIEGAYEEIDFRGATAPKHT